MKNILKYITVLFIFIGIEGFSQPVLEAPPRDGAWDKIHNNERTPIPYPPVRVADVMWSKRIWQVIDLRQKINLPFYYPIQPTRDRRSLVSILIDAVQAGELTAYSPIDDQFLIPLQPEELARMLKRVDTIQVQRLEPPYDWYDTVKIEIFDPSTVYKIRIKEDWFLDRQRSVQDVRIIGLCPVVDDVDEFGESRGDKPLFWINFEEARKIFVKEEFYNRFNDSKRLTYDDMFKKRMFGGTVIKESNEYDRRIAAYLTGIDALIEAEKIKDEIFKVEHDMWEF